MKPQVTQAQKLFNELDKDIKKVKKLFNCSKDTVDKDRYEKDQRFSKLIVSLKERTQMVQKHLFARRAQLTQQQYQRIQAVGDVHYLSQIVNETSVSNMQKWPKEKKCICGCGKAIGQPFPYCTDQENLTFFGTGVLLFFYYSKRILLFVVFAVLIYGIYALVTNVVGGNFEHDCVAAPGGLPFLCEAIRESTVKNKSPQNDLLIGQVWLALPMCLFWAIGIRLIRNFGRKKQQQINQKLQSSSDYCVWIQDLPSGKYSESDLIKYLNKLWRLRKKKDSGKLIIKSVQIIYQVSQMLKIIVDIRKKVFQIFQMYEPKLNKEVQEQQLDKIAVNNKLFRVKQNKVEDYAQAKKDLENFEADLKLFRKNILEKEDFRKNLAHETAIVQFYSAEQQNQFLSNYGRFQESKFKELKNKIASYCIDDEDSILFNGSSIKIIRAPEPSDINWANAAKDEDHLRTMAVWGINILLIGATFGTLMLFRFLATVSDVIKQAAIIKIIILNLFNRLIWNILNAVISIEENKTKTQSIASVMNKSYLAQSCNIIVLPMIINVAFDDNLYGPNGLSGAVHNYQITSFIFMLIFNFVNIPHRFTQLMVLMPCTRRLLIKYYCRVTDKFSSMEEIKQVLATLYQPPKLPLAGFYVYTTTTINQAFFFCHLQPTVLFYLLGNLCIFFCVNKFLLFKQCKIPDMLDFFIFQTMIIAAMNVPLFYAVGSTVLLSLGGQQDFVLYLPGVLCFIIWFLCSQNPFNIFSLLVTKIENCFFSQEEEKDETKRESKQKNHGSKVQIFNEVLNQQDDAVSIKTNIRRQNYYVGSPMIDLFNFQNKLGEFMGPYHNQFKYFCETFSFNMPKRKKKILVSDVE